MIKNDERDIIVLERMLKHCEDVKTHTDKFMNSIALFRDNIIYRCFLSMSVFQVRELSNQLSEEFKENHSDIPWRVMRNWFAHDYFEMDNNVTWETVFEDIPTLATFCEKAISEQK